MKVLKSIANYFIGVWTELKKVVWPSFTQMIKYFVAVVLGLALATAFVGGLDYFFVTYLLPLIIKQ